MAEPLCHAGPLLGRSLSTLFGWRPLPLHQLQDAGVGNAILYTISQGGCSYICYCALNLEARTAWPRRYDCFTWCRGCQPIQW